MASRGVRVSAQISPAMPKTVRMRTKNVLRALASMMRSSRNAFAGGEVLESWSFGVVGSGIGLPGLEGSLDFGFGVDQEIGAGDNALALFEARLDLIHV